MFPFKARKINYQHLSSNDNDLALPSSNIKRGTYNHLFTIFLALGWTATLLLYWHLSISTRKPLMPIPLEVFRPIIKVFEHDEWWSGMSAETQEHWNAQFAGMFSISHPVEAIDITGHGALWVEHPEKYGLTNGIVAEFDHPHKEEIEARFFIVSKLHEVHCLVSPLHHLSILPYVKES